ncbi:hypothetical protein RvY_12797 [Ramazzottius varieornatus]|uniref:C2H2-type domain-containing protein n=1 Tax=Ramazzottius varieornatus TaxID=947166 RepID=A0A1D1VKQ7_RAMVA|nr:hypothetical protein RvY_12797 [Ramazzottius varieornatus]
MMEQGEIFWEKEIAPKTSNSLLMGFHIFPSFIRLHLHVISSEFDSHYMRSAGVYSIFTTGFFLPPQKAIEILESGRKIDPQEIIGNEPTDWHSSLQCRTCSETFSSWTKLKEHLTVHDRDK